uniref:Retrotransposon gag domain-containing protein n=1 Tax=Phalaenopsis equestris TaxID=78828 RepID=A0A4P8VTG9_PHAEQ|nr:hypothetical protein [Phalaenopsis equestris]
MAKNVKEHVMESEATNVESSQGRGRQEQRDPVAPKPHGRSKEIMLSLDSRLARMEEAMNGMEGQVEELGQRADGLEEEDVTIHSTIRDMMLQLEETLMGQVAKLREDFMGKLQEVQSAYKEEMSDIRASFEEMRGDISLCKKALASSTSHPTFEARRIEVPKPMSFGGTRNAKEVDNFLWGLEQYFGAMGIADEDAKIQFASLYLSDIAMLWWRRRKGDVERGLCTMSTFNDFKRELKKQFYPENAEDVARARLRRLKQEGLIQGYIKEFTSLVLEIPDISDKDALFNFMDELQHWAKTELRRRGVQDLATAIAVAESLVDYSKEPRRPEDMKSGNSKGGDDKGKNKEEKRRESTPTKARDKWKAKNKQYQNRCFLCEGPHWARDCPQKKALNSLLASHKEESDRENDMEARVGSLQQLNAMQAPTKPHGKGLLFVEMTIGGKTTMTMINTGVSHNFISSNEAKRLGLQMTKGGGSIKVINSAEMSIDGVAKGVKTNIGAWSGNIDFSVIPLDDYKVVLGMNFLEQTRAFPMSFANSLCITEGSLACSIPIIRLSKQGS